MKQSTKRIVSLTASLAFVLGAIIIYALLVSTAYQNVQTLKGTIRGQESFYATNKKPIETARKLIADYDNPQVKERINLALPRDPQIGDALVQLTGIAENAKISAQSISISKAIVSQSEKKFNTGSSTLSIKPYGTVTFKVRFTGNYADYKNFLRSLENNVRIFNIQTLSVAPVDSKLFQDPYNFETAVVTYYQTSPN